MRRVLVIQDVGLWIELNRHFSGVASVDLVEAVSFDTGRLLAQIERPQIVVYGPDADGPGPDVLAKEFEEAGLTEIKVIGIDHSMTSGHTAPDRTAGKPAYCAADDLLDLVTELLSLCDEEFRPTCELLAHYEFEEAPGEESQSGFAVILELSDRRVTFESDVPLGSGCEMRLNFFLADPGSEPGRAQISFSCIVAQCRDEANLTYSARISKISEQSRRALQRHAAFGSSGAH